ncbi:serine/threonine-protein kinase [Streptomyces sp. NPDC046712]|uniref:serine/threonine-protein kinase n=1 Tax=Streptomyces sp. NPDC046712 TaxID=3154802 RepID=UPI0033FC2469
MEAGGMLADRYRLVAPLARGAQGTVWRAVDTRASRAEAGSVGETGEVAVKVSGSADVESLLRLVCEQSVRLGHPHVLTPVDWFVRDGEAWLVLPLVRGGTLAGLLADYGELPPAVGLLIAEQLLDALAAVHAAGLCHRDVKPSNVLLAATGEGRPHVFLGDFGVARVLPYLQLTSPGFVAGTPDYLAPEVRAGAGSSPAQDVYAAGLVLRALGGPSALVATMVADRPADRPTAAAARDEIARARAALGPERWPVLWADEPFVVPDQIGEAPPAEAAPFASAPAVPVPAVPVPAVPVPAVPAPAVPAPAVPAAVPAPAVPVTAPAPAVPAAGSVTAPAPAVPPVPPGPPARGPVRRRYLAWAAGGIAAAVAATILLNATGTEDKGGESPPPRTVPADTIIGPPDPDGPTAYTPCTAEEYLGVGFSPEGHALLCTLVPGTRRYEWTPST